MVRQRSPSGCRSGFDAWNGSSNASTAVSNEKPCLTRFAAAFFGSQVQRTRPRRVVTNMALRRAGVKGLSQRGWVPAGFRRDEPTKVSLPCANSYASGDAGALVPCRSTIRPPLEHSAGRAGPLPGKARPRRRDLVAELHEQSLVVQLFDDGADLPARRSYNVVLHWSPCLNSVETC